MAQPSAARLDRAVESLPRAYPGPGGAVAVLRGGEVAVRHAWGWANAERRILFTPATPFRVCSITKQFTCAAVLATHTDPSALDPDVAEALPRLEGPAPGALHLCHNQSGLRDYFAVAMLHGAAATAPFGPREAARVIGGARSLQFAPGACYSYANNNFRILSDILERRAGRDFADLLRARVLAPAGMETAFLAPDTAAMPGGAQGYEGAPDVGFRPAENQVIWTGDAALAASLDDMIAWERAIDAARDDPDGIYNRLSAPTTFADGRAAAYGFGLAHGVAHGRAVTGHGGALRGWRSHRLHATSERLSVVVLFNHMADARAATMDVLAAALGLPPPSPNVEQPMPDWLGDYLDPETRLAVRIDAAPPGRVRLRHGHAAELLDLQPDGAATGENARLRLRDGQLVMDRARENRTVKLSPCNESASPDGLAGAYRCDQLDAALHLADAGGIPYGAFSGFLGAGRMEALEPIGADLWALPCPRALDHTPPGDWTIAARRDAAGRVEALDVGCWLARGLRYRRTG